MLSQACNPAAPRILPATLFRESSVLQHLTDGSCPWSGGSSLPISQSCTDNLRVWAVGHTITLQQMLCALRMMPSSVARIQLCVIFWARLLDRANTWPKVCRCCPALNRPAVKLCPNQAFEENSDNRSWTWTCDRKLCQISLALLDCPCRAPVCRAAHRTPNLMLASDVLHQSPSR